MAGCFKLAARLCLLLALVLWATQDLGAKKKPPLHPVNLNTANSEQLQEVPGIGPATAEKILQARKSYGSFKSVDDLEAIKGIGPKRLDKMRKYLTVAQVPSGQKPATQAAASPKGSPPKKNEAPMPDAKQQTPPASDEEEQ
jgi:competence ComEA-like helix-hairpin-helix protein